MSDVQNVHLWRSGHNSCPGLNHNQSIAWSVIVCLSIRRCLSLSIFHMRCWQTHSCGITKIILSTGQKSNMLRSHRFSAMIKFGISRRSSLSVVRTDCAGTLSCWNLSWFSAFDFMKNVKYAGDRIYCGICLPRISKVDLGQSYCKNKIVQFFYLHGSLIILIIDYLVNWLINSLQHYWLMKMVFLANL